MIHMILRQASRIFPLGLTLMLALPAIVVAETCYLDTPSGYTSMGGAGTIGPYSSQSECESVKSRYFASGGSCRCSGGSSAAQAYTGANPYEAMANMFFSPMGQALGKVMECALGACESDPRTKAAAKMYEQIKRREQELKRAEEDRKRAEEKRRKDEEFALGKADALSRLRGENAPELGVRELNGAQGSRAGLGLREIGLASFASSLHRLQCGSHLLALSNNAALRGDYAEASFLSNEAAMIISNEKQSPSVECPPPPVVSDVDGAPLSKSAMEAEALKKRGFVMSTIFQRGAREVGELKELEAELEKSEDKFNAARTELSTAKEKVSSLKETGQIKPLDADSSAMEEALAALRLAEDALEESETELSAIKKTQDELKGKLKETMGLYNKASDNSRSSIDELYKQLKNEK